MTDSSSTSAAPRRWRVSGWSHSNSNDGFGPGLPSGASIRASVTSSMQVALPLNSVQDFVHAQSRIKDESNVFNAFLILEAVIVSVLCGVAAFVLHMAVGYAGCFGGVNGCHDHLLLDAVKPLIGTSPYFVITCGLTGLICSLVLYSPMCGNSARVCKGGGSGHTKIVVASGAKVSGWVVVLRVVLAAIYMGGGNPLGTEGPIIHLSVSLATWVVSRTGKKRRKFLGTFAVIGAAAGISAGFNVLVTGFVYVIEELTRTLSRKLALILAFAAAVAVLFKEVVEKTLEIWIHPPHASLVPAHETWAKLTQEEVRVGLLLSVPIGVLMGFAGWIFTNCAFHCLTFLRSSVRLRKVLPEISHLAIIGVICGCLGAIGYEVTGMNGVWGTTVDAIPQAIKKNVGWGHLLLLFSLKFCAFILATAGSGPGGLLVPSLVTGGLLALALARAVGASDNLSSGCAVIGMGAMFASVMHMPLTGVIIIFELTRADNLMLHVVIANFISSNITYRLPHGDHSFVHRCLEQDPTWTKLDHRDFIETDLQEQDANLALFDSLKCMLLTDADLTRIAFDAWVAAMEIMAQEARDARQSKRTNTISFISGPGGMAQRLKRSNSRNASTLSSVLPSLQKSRTMSVAPALDGASNLKLNADIAANANTKRMLIRANSADSLPSAGNDLKVVDLGDDAVRRLERGDLRLGSKASAGGDASKVSGDIRAFSKATKVSAASGVDSDEKTRRKNVKDDWEAVSSIIPNMTVRLWKSFDANQREALSMAARMLQGGLATPNGIDSPGWCKADSTPPSFLRLPGRCQTSDLEGQLLASQALREEPLAAQPDFPMRCSSEWIGLGRPASEGLNGAGDDLAATTRQSSEDPRVEVVDLGRVPQPPKLGWLQS